MRYLVVSDNHGDRAILEELFERYQGSVDGIFHCGDSELEANDPLWQNVFVVRGNCDYSGGYPNSLIEAIGSDVIYMTHGHLANVRFGLNQLSYQSEESHANLVFFGHTHEIGCQRFNNTLFLNPGSIKQPRGQIQIQSYAIVESTPDAFDVQYHDRTHQAVPELHFFFKKA